ncbi:LOB domain-containing protein 1-like [Salvia miltiorrhiza]|uniref:LOB domain-containing protein 1-like n=1 Tax=Salvia miltiorrhiza TaxID=226208 RepID=UPI0025ABAFDA|nr:LOB domain-containing protein 1-like [Salvia miltiorrhiza]
MHQPTTTSAAATVVLEAGHWPSLTLPASSAILTLCAACKTLRRRCVEKCMLAPYFPPDEPLKFAIAHRIFGASNIIKLLQEVGEGERADAVNSMVYEANARLRDPIYGCAGAICHLQKQIDHLQIQLATAHAQILNLQCHNAILQNQFCKTQQPSLDDEGILGVGDPLWT